MMILKIAWNNLWRNYRRTIITVASVFFATFLALVMTSIQEGSYDQMIKNTVGMYSGYIQVQDTAYWEERSLENTFTFTEDLRHEIEQTPGIAQFVPRLESFVLASTGELTKGTMIVGIDPEKEVYLMNPEKNLVKGRFLDSSDMAVILASGLAENLKADVGDSVVLIGQGFRGINAVGLYPVKGIIRFPSPELNKRLMFMPLTEAQYMFGAENRLTAISIMVNDPKETREVQRDLQSRVDEDIYSIMDWKTMNPDLVQMIEVDRQGGYIMLVILYLIAAFGVLGTVIMMTMERRREFGILLSIGMRPIKLVWMMVTEVFLLTASAIIAGIIISYPLLYYFNVNPIRFTGRMEEMMAQYGMEAIMPASIAPSIFINQAIVVFIFSMLTTFYPTLNIFKLNTADAIKG